MRIPKRKRARYLLFLLLIVLGVVFLSVGGCTLVRAGWYRHKIGRGMKQSVLTDTARLDQINKIPVLHLYGSPGEMGAQYGTILKKPLNALKSYMDTLLPKIMLKRFLAYAESHEALLPDSVRQELHGIAEASGVPYTYLAAMNLIPKIRCSTLAAWGSTTQDGKLLMGRNAEYFGMGLADRGSLVIVYHPKDGIPVAAVSFLGMVGTFTGVNAEGVCFGNMLVFNANNQDAVENGLPIALLLRLAAHHAKSAQEMANILQSQVHVIPVNVMLADSREAVVLELAGAESRVRRGEGEFLAATNYFRTNAMRRNFVSCERYDTLAAAGESANLDVAAIQAALHKARIEKLNLQSVVFEPERMQMHVSVNRVPASGGPYTVFDLEELFSLEE